MHWKRSLERVVKPLTLVVRYHIINESLSLFSQKYFINKLEKSLESSVHKTISFLNRIYRFWRPISVFDALSSRPEPTESKVFASILNKVIYTTLFDTKSTFEPILNRFPFKASIYLQLFLLFFVISSKTPFIEEQTLMKNYFNKF